MFHVIDDDKSILDVLASVLAVLGYDAKTFDSPASYLTHMGSGDYDAPVAVLSDVRMPEMDGFQMMKVVHESNGDVRFVMISGYSDVDYEADNGACIYLRKPFSMAKLEKALSIVTLCQKQGCAPDEYGCLLASDTGTFDLDHWRCPHAGKEKEA